MKEKLKKLYNFSNTWTGTIIIVLLVIFFIAQAFVIPSGSMKKTLLIGDHLFVKKFSYGVPIPHLPWLELPVFPDIKGNGHLIDAEGPKREDIVVFRYPSDEKIHFVKRCVAVGEDEVIYSAGAFYLHPHEGDEYIKKNYPKEKIHTLLNKLWVKNPYINKYPGIHYESPKKTVEQMTLALLSNSLSMKPIFVKDLPNISPNVQFNAFYTKVKKDEYFMMGDNRDNSNDSRFWGTVPYRLIVGKPWFIYFSWDDDYIIRWDRIGRFISTVQSSKEFIK